MLDMTNIFIQKHEREGDIYPKVSSYHVAIVKLIKNSSQKLKKNSNIYDPKGVRLNRLLLK